MELRKVQRPAVCRGCAKALTKQVDDIIYMYSSVGQGQNILICLDCVEKMYKLVQETYATT